MTNKRNSSSALLAFLLFIGCQAPADIPPLPGAAAVEPNSMTVVHRGPLPVRLAAHEGEHGVTIDDARGGTRHLEREADAIRSSDGTRARWFEFLPADGRAGVRIGDRVYPGRIRIEPRPEGGLRVTNHVELEDYVSGVVAAEVVLWSSKPAELQAQAVAARTYALASLGRLAHGRFLWDDTRDQAYRGVFRPANAGEVKVAARLQRAVEDSRGLVLWNDEVLYDARFHASCGGHTATLGDVFPSESVIFAGAVSCAPCRTIGRSERGAGETAGRVAWAADFANADLDRLARELRIGNRLLSVRVARMDLHGRWLALECTGESGRRQVEWNEIRRRLDAGVLKSGMIVNLSPGDGRRITDGVRFEGVGRGHGVGLCQVGSHALAGQGLSAEEILEHYYPLARLAPLPRTRAAH